MIQIRFKDFLLAFEVGYAPIIKYWDEATIDHFPVLHANGAAKDEAGNIIPKLKYKKLG